jgi:hypothetical protein
MGRRSAVRNVLSQRSAACGYGAQVAVRPHHPKLAATRERQDLSAVGIGEERKPDACLSLAHASEDRDELCLPCQEVEPETEGCGRADCDFGRTRSPVQ